MPQNTRRTRSCYIDPVLLYRMLRIGMLRNDTISMLPRSAFVQFRTRIRALSSNTMLISNQSTANNKSDPGDCYYARLLSALTGEIAGHVAVI